jgi:phospholipase C
MNARREFLKKAALLSGAATLPNVIPMSIQKAMAINADPNSTFYDAEHVVILMQENRSFDHMFGTLKGVRGFNDPRPFTLPDQDQQAMLMHPFILILIRQRLLGKADFHTHGRTNLRPGMAAGTINGSR